MKPLFLIVVFFPVLAFLTAGVNEMRSDNRTAQRVRALIPIVVGLLSFVLFLNPQFFLHVTPASSVSVSRLMTLLSALVSSAGAFFNYSRRGSSALVASGGLLMAFLWMFFGQVRA